MSADTTPTNVPEETGFSVCVIVPAFNEAGTIADVVHGARACAYVDDVVVVDDGSTDETVTRASHAGGHVLRHEQNRGKGHAVRTGLAFALDRDSARAGKAGAANPLGEAVEDRVARNFTHVLLMDGDMQHRPADVPAMIEAARAHDVDLVVGERVFDKSQMPSSRYYSNVIGSRALSAFIGSEVRDSQSGFRLIRCEILRGMPLSATGYEIETEMLIKLARRRARMTSVPVQLSYGAKSKLRPIRDTTRTCFLAVYYRFLSRD